MALYVCFNHDFSSGSSPQQQHYNLNDTVFVQALTNY
ncbi:hypothetical protein Ga0123462_0121 [Mariprofundus ferrinatatus]|uniref:Uncharacterized protein n=1 Tax=Mariprofundus ferrinatatus TaxID=1921087 RepID=A0A2K8L436_9PROT|nr:hypothetical protein Ga0123462_0121 [Mariprofundus ferrinatatus]